MGFALGLGAPLGWLALQFFIANQTVLNTWLNAELARSGPTYFYMTVGTVTVFTLFGYFLGRLYDRLTDKTEAVTEALNEVNLLAVTDALTRIPNARYLHDHLVLEIESAKRYASPMTVLMLDIDDFKKINDEHGHPIGDQVLTTLAKTIQECVRSADIVGRLGGEEFLVIMPHTPANTAVAVAERIRKAIQNQTIKSGGVSIGVTVSLGVASFPSKNITDKSSLLKAADDALYQAKRAGKNKTVIADDAVSIPQYTHLK